MIPVFQANSLGNSLGKRPIGIESAMMTNPAMTKSNHHAPTQPGSDGDAVTLVMGDKN